MRREPEPKSRFVLECERILQARLQARTAGEREDTDWALTFLFQMHRTGRLEEYFAQRERS